MERKEPALTERGEPQRIWREKGHERRIPYNPKNRRGKCSNNAVSPPLLFPRQRQWPNTHLIRFRGSRTAFHIAHILRPSAGMSLWAPAAGMSPRLLPHQWPRRQPGPTTSAHASGPQTRKTKPSTLNESSAQPKDGLRANRRRDLLSAIFFKAASLAILRSSHFWANYPEIDVSCANSESLSSSCRMDGSTVLGPSAICYAGNTNWRSAVC